MWKKTFLILLCTWVAACNFITDKMIEMGEPTYQTKGKLPIQFNQAGAQYSSEFDIPKDGDYAIYLLFHALSEDKDPKNIELNSQIV